MRAARAAGNHPASGAIITTAAVPRTRAECAPRAIGLARWAGGARPCRLVLSTEAVGMSVAALALPMLPRWTAIMPPWLQPHRAAIRAAADRDPAPPASDDQDEPTPPNTPPASSLERRSAIHK